MSRRLHREPSELERLKLFLERCDELFGSAYIKNSEPLRFSMVFKKGVFTYEFENPPDEDYLKSFLLSFRHFVSNDSPVFVFKVYNLLQMRLPDGELKEGLKSSRTRFQAAQKIAGLQIVRGKEDDSSQDVPVTPEQIWDMWCNGKYFHSELDKRADLDSLSGWGKGLLRFNFFEYLANVTQEVNYMELAIKEVLDKHPAAFGS